MVLTSGIQQSDRCAKVASVCDPMDSSPPGSSVRGILQARILEGVAMLSSRGSSRLRDWTTSFMSPALAGRFFTTRAVLPILFRYRIIGYYKIFNYFPVLWASQVAQWLRMYLPIQETQVRSLGREDALEEEMATHSSILAWRTHGQRSLVGYSLWGHKK